MRKDLNFYMKKMRRIKNVSVQEAADILRISAEEYMRYESGQERVSPTYVMNLADALELSLKQLIDEDEERTKRRKRRTSRPHKTSSRRNKNITIIIN